MNLRVSSAAPQGVFIGNRWRPAVSGLSVNVWAPADGLVFAKIAAGGAASHHRPIQNSYHR